MRHGQCRHPSSRGDILALWVYHQALQANASLLAGHKPILAFSLPLPIKAFIDIGSSNKNSFLNLINSCFSRPETESQRFEGLFLSLKKIVHRVWGWYSLWPVRKEKTALGIWFIQVQGNSNYGNHLQSIPFKCRKLKGIRDSWGVWGLFSDLNPSVSTLLTKFSKWIYIISTSIVHEHMSPLLTCSWMRVFSYRLRVQTLKTAKPACDQICVNIKPLPSYIHCGKVKMSYPWVSLDFLGQSWTGMPQRVQGHFGLQTLHSSADRKESSQVSQQ